MPSMSNHRTTTNQTFYCLHNLDFCFEFGCFIENAQKSDNILQLNVVSWIFTFSSKKKKDIYARVNENKVAWKYILGVSENKET